MKRIILILLASVATIAASAKIGLPSVLSDNMVIQRDTKAAIWGTAKPGAKVTVSTTWSKQKYVVTADSQTGKWSTRIQTPAAGGPYEIKISDGEAVTLKNVLSGDVWYCGGQSNMQMPMKGFNSQPIKGAAEMIARAKASRPIRMCTIERRSSPVVLESTVGSWKESNPETVANTSAVAYYFAELLQDAIEVPVGLLICEWGGSSIETWLTREVIESQFAGEFDLSHLAEGAEVKKNDNHSACLLYNGQVAALVPFTFKGMLWYQGETNRDRCEQYVRLQTAYAAMMRELFQVPDAPFYFVQIAPYEYGDESRFDSGYFYEAQAKTLDIIPNSGMAVTCDVGEWNTIHPCQKEPVGHRLAFLALKHTYGFEGFSADAPRYRSVEFKDGKAIVTVDTFDWEGLAPRNLELAGFEVAGADRVFHPATGRCDARGWEGRNEILVSCPEVAEPVAVRYAFRNYQPGTVFNCSGIPLAPFRTDDWDDIQK